MAEAPAAEPKSQFGFLTRKVGPLPVWGWAAIAVGGYYWYTHYGPGASKAAAAAAAPAAAKPQVVMVDQNGQPLPGPPGPGGPPGPPGPPGPRGKKPPPHEPPPRKRKPPPKKKLPRGRTGPPLVPPHIVQSPVPADIQPAAAEPVTVAAPMTAGDVYGTIPTAMPDGTTYDSGYPSAAQLEGAYVPAG